MRQVKRSAIVPYSAGDMFDIVDDVERYPDFLPWCTGAQVESRSDEELVASLRLTRGGIERWFTTRNRRDRPASIGLALVDGPFSTLTGGWTFRPIGAGGSEIRLELEFAFSNFFVDLTIGPYFEQTCNSLVDAFIERAAELQP